MKLKILMTILLSSLLLVAYGGTEKENVEAESQEVALNDGEITATIEVQAIKGLPTAVSAERVYSAMGDELLLHEGWRALTVSFVDSGAVSMDRSQYKDEDTGPYSPTAEIMK